MAGRFTARPTRYYWATESDPKKLSGEIRARVKEYWDQCEAEGRLGMWRSALAKHYGLDAEGRLPRAHQITYGGRQGELTFSKINHFRSLVRHIVVMTTANRPAFEARAVNSDASSLGETKIAEGTLDYYLGEGGVEDEAIRAVETGVVCGLSWVEVTWDMHAGDEIAPSMPEVDPMTGEEIGAARPPVKAGDISVSVLEPWDVACDLYLAPKDHRWRIVTDRGANRWELAAKYPEHAEEILKQGSNADDETYAHGLWDWQREERDPDKVVVRHLWHKRTDAMPLGRYVMSCGDAILFDGPIPYDDLPQIEFLPSQEIGTGSGYADVWDIMGLQTALDSVASAALTNHDAFGVHNVLVPDNANLGVEQIGPGLQMVKYNATATGGAKPEVLDLLRIDEATFKLHDLFLRSMEQLSGVNQVSRGDPPPQLKSGAALALVQSMALQYNSGIQRAYTRMLERLGTTMLRVLQTYATEPRILEIVGRDNRSMVTEFSSASIQSVRKVIVNLGNPIMRTTAGRVEMADTLIKLPPEERETYLSVVDTGRLPHRYEADRARSLLIRAENERLADGRDTPVLATDPHDLHIEEHLSLLSDPDVRENQGIASIVLAHIQEHIDLKMQLVATNPELAAITGNALAAPPPPPMGAGGPGGPPPMGGPGGPPPEGGPIEVPGAEGGPPMPAGMPSMPTNPLTGEQAPAA